MAETYRNAELPFKIYGVPDIEDARDLPSAVPLQCKRRMVGHERELFGHGQSGDEQHDLEVESARAMQFAWGSFTPTSATRACRLRRTPPAPTPASSRPCC